MALYRQRTNTLWILVHVGLTATLAYWMGQEVAKHFHRQRHGQLTAPTKATTPTGDDLPLQQQICPTTHYTTMLPNNKLPSCVGMATTTTLSDSVPTTTTTTTATVVSIHNKSLADRLGQRTEQPAQPLEARAPSTICAAEALVHPILLSHSYPRRVALVAVHNKKEEAAVTAAMNNNDTVVVHLDRVVVGTLQQVLKHKTVEECVVFVYNDSVSEEYDMKSHWIHWNLNDDSRVTVVIVTDFVNWFGQKYESRNDGEQDDDEDDKDDDDEEEEARENDNDENGGHGKFDVILLSPPL